jgi:hypothetical protein
VWGRNFLACPPRSRAPRKKNGGAILEEALTGCFVFRKTKLEKGKVLVIILLVLGHILIMPKTLTNWRIYAILLV